MKVQQAQKDYATEAKRIADEIRATEEHIEELERERSTMDKHIEDLKVQYKEIFLKANLERLTAFREECRQRSEMVNKQLGLLQNEKHVLRLQLKKEIDGHTFNSEVQKISKKMRIIRELYNTYYNTSIADLVGTTEYDEYLIKEFIFGSGKTEQDKEMTIEDVYQRRLEIISSPTSFTKKITNFSAGGLGACVYNKNVTIAELARCWEYDEFRFVCPECGKTAYIYQFAGSISAGGYWELNAYCPTCKSQLHFRGKDNPVKIHWHKLGSISDAVSRHISKMKNEAKPDE